MISRLPLCACVALVACGPTAPVTVVEAWSESGAARLHLSSDTVSLGVDTLTLRAEDELGAPLVGLSFQIEATMPDMGHGAGVAEVSELGDGAYQLTTELDMTGLWILDGLILGAVDDPFLLAVEAW